MRTQCFCPRTLGSDFAERTKVRLPGFPDRNHSLTESPPGNNLTILT